MSMPRLLFHLSGLFDSPNMRGLSEDAVLWGLEVLTNWDVDYLKTHSETPKLYDSGVVYALPDQMTSKMTPADIEATRQFVLKRGASRDSADHVAAFLEGMEVFRDVPAVLQLGKVDCDNLSAFRTAELRLAGAGEVQQAGDDFRGAEGLLDDLLHQLSPRVAGRQLFGQHLGVVVLYRRT